MKDFLKVVVVVGVLGFFGWLIYSAGSYNSSRMELCERHDMVMAQEYMFGPYGCAKVIPFEEVESYD